MVLMMNKTIEKYHLLSIIKDAYNSHLNYYLIRCNKNYKMKSKKEHNDKLKQYHKEKMKEYDDLIQFLLQKENNLIIKK